MYDQFVWVEKYRPKFFTEIMLPERIMKEAKGFVERGVIPNLLFVGSQGIGKTTLAFVLANELDYDYLLVNCSDEGRFLDTFRNKVQNFCSGISIEGKRKVIFLDEIDNLTHDVQSLLRGFIEKFSGNCSFIATCNFENRIMEPLHSRFAKVEFKITAEEKADVVVKMFKRICLILDNEKVTYDKMAVSKLVGKYFPDFRKLLNELQRYAATGVIDSGVFVAASDDVSTLIEHLKNKSWVNMRKWVAMQSNLELTHLCRTLLTRSDDFMSRESLPSFVILAAEAQYKNAFVADKEINTMAFLTQVMGNCEFTK